MPDYAQSIVSAIFGEDGTIRALHRDGKLYMDFWILYHAAINARVSTVQLLIELGEPTQSDEDFHVTNESYMCQC